MIDLLLRINHEGLAATSSISIRIYTPRCRMGVEKLSWEENKISRSWDFTMGIFRSNSEDCGNNYISIGNYSARVSLNATQILTEPQYFEANSIHTLKSKYQHTLRGPKDIITIKMVSWFLFYFAIRKGHEGLELNKIALGAMHGVARNLGNHEYISPPATFEIEETWDGI